MVANRPQFLGQHQELFCASMTRRLANHLLGGDVARPAGRQVMLPAQVSPGAMEQAYLPPYLYTCTPVYPSVSVHPAALHFLRHLQPP